MSGYCHARSKRGNAKYRLLSDTRLSSCAARQAANAEHRPPAMDRSALGFFSKT